MKFLPTALGWVEVIIWCHYRDSGPHGHSSGTDVTSSRRSSWAFGLGFGWYRIRAQAVLVCDPTAQASRANPLLLSTGPMALATRAWQPLGGSPWGPENPYCHQRACRVFTSRGGGVNRAPQNWGGGFGKRAQLTGTINQSL